MVFDIVASRRKRDRPLIWFDYRIDLKAIREALHRERKTEVGQSPADHSGRRPA
jgi:hypothetical protein